MFPYFMGRKKILKCLIEVKLFYVLTQERQVDQNQTHIILLIATYTVLPMLKA